jgi:hypothetical protein
MPENQEEAEQVYGHWDARNGRYYFIADIVLDDGILRRGVVFDGDSNIAVEINSNTLPVQPEFFGRLIVALLITLDCSLGHQRSSGVTDIERQVFYLKYGDENDEAIRKTGWLW